MSTKTPKKSSSSARNAPPKRSRAKTIIKPQSVPQAGTVEPFPGWDSIPESRTPSQDLEDAANKIASGMKTLVDYIESEEFKGTNWDPDELLTEEWDEAALLLTASFRDLANEVSRLASNGHDDCTEAVWTVAKQFTEAVTDLAFDEKASRVLETHARRSLFLPSLRARPVGFTHNFQAIAEKLHLSEDCICHMADSAAHKLDAPITRLVAEIVEKTGLIQQELRVHCDFFRKQTKSYSKQEPHATTLDSRAENVRRLCAMSEEEYLTKNLRRKGADLQCIDLPPLTKVTVDEWWSKVVRQAIVDRYPSLTGTRLHDSLNGHKDHEKLDDLRRRAKSSLRSLAPQATRPLEGRSA